MSKITRTFALMSTALLALSVSMPAQADDQIVLRVGHSSAADEPYQKGSEEMKRVLEDLTDGGMTLEIFPNSQLGNEMEMIEGVLLGTLDITMPSNAVLTNFVPEMIVFDMPFLFRDRDHLYAVMDGPVGEELGEIMADQGFRLLTYYEVGLRHIMTVDGPVETIDDLEGMRIRTMENPAHVAAFNAFGANATPLAYGELYGALQSGVVDGAEAANSNYHAQSFYEVAPNWAQVSWTALVAPVFMSEEKWQTLTEEQQDALLEAAAASAEVERQLYADEDEARLESLIEAGVNVTYPDPEPFRERAQQVYDEFITDPDSQRRIQEIIETGQDG